MKRYCYLCGSPDNEHGNLKGGQIKRTYGITGCYGQLGFAIQARVELDLSGVGCSGSTLAVARCTFPAVIVVTTVLSG